MGKKFKVQTEVKTYGSYSYHSDGCYENSSMFYDMLFTLSTSYIAYSIYTMLKYQDFLLIILLIANSGNYLHLSIVVNIKTVCNNNLLSVHFNFNSNY